MQLGSYRPVYSQLVDHIVLDILEGSYTAGQQLPAVSAMAVTMQVNPSIVEHAYAELVAQGVLHQDGDEFTITEQALALLKHSERQRFLQHDFPSIRKRIKLLEIDPNSLDWDE